MSVHFGDDYTMTTVTLTRSNKRLRWIDFRPEKNEFYTVDLGRVDRGVTVQIPQWFETKLRQAGFVA